MRYSTQDHWGSQGWQPSSSWQHWGNWGSQQWQDDSWGSQQYSSRWTEWQEWQASPWKDDRHDGGDWSWASHIKSEQDGYQGQENGGGFSGKASPCPPTCNHGPQR